MSFHFISEQQYLILAEGIATAILCTKDESGDLVQDLLDVANELGIQDEVSQYMAELVRRAE